VELRAKGRKASSCPGPQTLSPTPQAPGASPKDGTRKPIRTPEHTHGNQAPPLAPAAAAGADARRAAAAAAAARAALRVAAHRGERRRAGARRVGARRAGAV